MTEASSEIKSKQGVITHMRNTTRLYFMIFSKMSGILCLHWTSFKQTLLNDQSHQNCCALLRIAPLCIGWNKKTPSLHHLWLTRCHLTVKHRNGAQGLDSLTARSLQRSTTEPAGICAFNRIRSKKRKDLSFLYSLFGWLLEACKSSFFLPLTHYHNSVQCIRALQLMHLYRRAPFSDFYSFWRMTCKYYAWASVCIYIS